MNRLCILKIYITFIIHGILKCFSGSSLCVEVYVRQMLALNVEQKSKRYMIWEFEAFEGSVPGFVHF